MGSIEIFILILAVVVCLLLALIILVQNPKGGGLATGFSGTASVGGVQKTADFLEKSTWYLVVALFVLCLLSAKFSTTTVISGGDEDKTEQTQEETEPEEEGAVVPENTSIEEMLEGGNTDGESDGNP